MHIFFQNNQYLGSYYFTRSADDPVVGAFNQEKALVGAFSVIVQLHRSINLRHHEAALKFTDTLKHYSLFFHQDVCINWPAKYCGG